jgi:predicted AlkP superfamily phosphohydrolase/phosphomutase
LIEIDGLNWDIIFDQIKKGNMPNFEKLLKNSAYGNLTSVLPFSDSVNWASFVTGKNPGKTGIFKSFEPTTDKPPYMYTEPFWEDLVKKEKKVIILNSYEPKYQLSYKKSITEFPFLKLDFSNSSKYNLNLFLKRLSESKLYFTNSSKYYLDYAIDIYQRKNVSYFINITVANASNWRNLPNNCYNPLEVSTNFYITENKSIPIYFLFLDFTNNSKNDYSKVLISFSKNVLKNISIISKNEWSNWILLNNNIFRFKLLDIENDNLLIYLSPIELINPNSYYKSPPAIRYSYELFNLYMNYNKNIEISSTLYEESLDEFKTVSNNTITLLKNNDQWDFFLIGFKSTDIFLHSFYYKNDEYSKKFFINLDNFLGNITHVIDDNTILLITSNHGFKPVNKCLLINSWLNKIGLLNFKNTTSDTYLDIDIDYSKTKAYSTMLTRGIWINLENINDSYEQIRDYIINSSKILKDSNTGNEIIHIYKKENVFWGNYTNLAPDLIFDFNDNYFISWDTPKTSEVISETQAIGHHDKNGILLISGNRINKIEINRSILDIVPTIMYFYDIPIPEDIDGKALKEIIKPIFFN